MPSSCGATDRRTVIRGSPHGCAYDAWGNPAQAEKWRKELAAQFKTKREELRAAVKNEKLAPEARDEAMRKLCARRRHGEWPSMQSTMGTQNACAYMSIDSGRYRAISRL